MNASELRDLASKYVHDGQARVIVEEIAIQLPAIKRKYAAQIRRGGPDYLKAVLRTLTVRRAIDARRAARRAAALARLIPVDREALEAVAGGATPEQAAAMVGVPVAIFCARLSRARRLLSARAA